MLMLILTLLKSNPIQPCTYNSLAMVADVHISRLKVDEALRRRRLFMYVQPKQPDMNVECRPMSLFICLRFGIGLEKSSSLKGSSIINTMKVNWR